MKSKKTIALILTALIVVGNLFTFTAFAAPTSNITMTFDKTTAAVGEIITGTLSITDIANFAGYQVNLKYDPTVLKAVDPSDPTVAFTDDSTPADGTILKKTTYTPFPIATNKIAQGILNFSKSYMKLDSYRASGVAETTGSVAVVAFQVLKSTATAIKFEDASTMPGAITGTQLFDWFGNKITSGYTVTQPAAINGSVPTSSTNPPTNTPTPTPTPASPTATIPVGSSYITLDMSKTTVAVDEIFTASLKINNVPNFAGYQVNIKYDPTLVSPVDDSGVIYTDDTMPADGTILIKTTYTPFPIATNKVAEGILNFSKSYMKLDSYKASGAAETTGTLAVIKFKALKAGVAASAFADTSTMPKAITGTQLFNWDGNQITSGYTVKQPASVTISGVPTSNTPTPTPTPTTATVTPTPTPTDNTGSGNITLQLDSTKAVKDAIITGTLKIDNIAKFAGYQVNLKYDKAVLQPVDADGVPYTDDTMPADGTILVKTAYTPFPIATNNVANGILNFSKSYMKLDSYRASGVAETTGALAVIRFKVLQAADTQILFADASTMPKAITGTQLFNWDGNQISSGYSVIQPSKIVKDDGQVLTMKVNIGSGKAAAGAEVTIPVNFAEIPAVGINNCNFTLSYDSTKLDFVSATAGSIASNPQADFGANSPSAGTIKFLYNDLSQGANPITTNGTFANIKFKVKAGIAIGQTAQIAVNSVSTFNAKGLLEVTPTFTSGTVTVISNVKLGDVDVDGDVDSTDYAYMRQYLLGMINAFPGGAIGMTAADVDEDGDVDSTDYAYVRQYLLGMINEFPGDKN